MTERIEYRDVIDKTTWGDGPWQSEPDKIQWQDAKTGLPCLIVRAHHGAWCGYVGVSPGHALHGRDYDDCPDFAVHGGLTFAHGCGHGDPARDICHSPGVGEPDDVWWLGFDCAHGGDLAPRIRSLLDSLPHNQRPPEISSAVATLLLDDYFRDTYRDQAYVEAQVAALARQVAAAADK